MNSFRNLEIIDLLEVDGGRKVILGPVLPGILPIKVISWLLTK